MRWIALIALGIISMACTTFEVRVERPSQTDAATIATLANLMFEGTQYAQILSTRSGTPDPNSTVSLIGTISGDVCYPGSTIPAMTLFFRNLFTEEIFELDSKEYQDEFTLNVPEGSYYVYAWVPQYMVGGLYSENVICGGTPQCTDHSPVMISVKAGESINNINICDWGFNPDDLPLPPGVQLFGKDTQTQPIE